MIKSKIDKGEHSNKISSQQFETFEGMKSSALHESRVSMPVRRNKRRLIKELETIEEN